MKEELKLIVTGFGEHGKDTVCEILQKVGGYTFASSSWIAAEEVVFSVLSLRYGYETVQECFGDRRNHREEWHELIKAYNTPDKARLGSYIFQHHDIYCGLRCIKEFKAIKEKYPNTVSVWVDAFERLGQTETKDSITITAKDCDIVVKNNGTKEQLQRRGPMLVSYIYELRKKETLPGTKILLNDVWGE